MATIDFDAFDLLGAPVVVLDLEGGVVHWNRACAELIGRHLDEIRGKRIWELAPTPAEVASVKETFLALRADKGAGRLETRWISRNGEERRVAWSSSAVLGADGEVERIVATGLDVTTRDRDCEAERARFRDLLELAPDGIFIADLEGRYTDVNGAGCRLLGCTRAEILGKRITDLIPPEEVERLWEVREKLVGGATDTREWRLRRRDGTYVPVEVSSNILPGGQWLGFVREITERKAHEAERERLFDELEAKRRWLQAVIDTVPLAALLFEPGGRISFNRRTEELLGMKLSPLGGSAQYRSRILFPDGAPVPPEQLPSNRVLKGGETIVGAEYLVERGDGSRIPVLGSAAPIRDDAGTIIGGVGVFQDMSERMRAEDVIRTNERLLNGIFEILPVGVWIADHTGRIVRTNPSGLRIWAGARYVGVSEFGEYKGWWADTGKPIAAEEWAIARALKNGETSIGELIRIQCFDGTFKTIINSALPLYDEQGKFAGAVVVNEDVTKLREIEEALRRAVKARDEVLAIVAHDLRNPLNTILMNLYLLRRRRGEPERRNLQPVEAIQRQATRMNRLIQDLLDVARLEGGSLSVQPSRTSAEKILGEIEASQRGLVASASLELHMDVESALPEVWADHDRLLQVLENLVGNAVKFTAPGGHVTVGAAPREGEVLFWVADSGSGVAAEHIPHLFDPFWQADKADRRGAGLGLPIVKGLVEAHGGRIWVESKVGMGTTFHFTIPVAAPEEARGGEMRSR